jgi:hypothetical protein
MSFVLFIERLPYATYSLTSGGYLLSLGTNRITSIENVTEGVTDPTVSCIMISQIPFDSTKSIIFLIIKTFAVESNGLLQKVRIFPFSPAGKQKNDYPCCMFIIPK